MTGPLAAALAAALAAGPAPAERPVRLASKAFTESEVLAEAGRELVAAEGLPAEHRRSLGGTRVLWEALLRGDVDADPEYTGTISREILAGAVPPDEGALRAAFRDLQKTVVLVTHDLAEAVFFARTLVLLESGRVAQVGSIDELRRAPAVPSVARFVRAHRGLAFPAEDAR